MKTNPERSGSDDTDETRPNILKRIEGHIQSKTLAGSLISYLCLSPSS